MSHAHPHEMLLADMVRELRRLLSDLGEVTREQHREFERGLYGCLNLKPSKRVATALSTTREIGVIVTTFADLQQRTVAVAKDYIQSSKGRLDSSVAVIAHQDPRADDSLREWGKDLGLLVLPVFMSGGWKQEGGLEDLLSRFLFASDPFDLAGPIRKEAQFYGRSEATDVARRLQDGQVRAYFGIRKIGKTSVVNRIVEQATTKFGALCVMADCQSDGLSSLSAAQFLDSVTGAMLEAREDTGLRYRSVIPVAVNENITDAQWQLQHAIENTPGPIVVVLDEVDFITPASPTAEHWRSDFNVFFRSLRAVYQETCRTNHNFSIVVSGVSSRWFFAESVAGVENAALGFVPEEYLGPFHRAQSVNMIKTLGHSAGLLFADDAANRLAEVCGDMPYWMRKCGSFVHGSYDFEDRPVQVNLDRCSELADVFTRGDGAELAEVSLRHLLRVFPELVPALESAYVGEAASSRREERLRQALKRYGVLTNDGMLRGPLMTIGLEAALEAVLDDEAASGAQRLSRPPSVAELLDTMENERVEFKASARHSYKPDVPEQTINEGVIKSVAGFANAQGGTLAVGIDDDGRVLGIESDLRLMKGNDTDTYSNWLTTLITTRLSANVAALCRIRYESTAEKRVCLIDVPPSSEPVFATTAKNSKVFFVRSSNSTRPMDGTEMVAYIRDRFPR